MLHPNAAFIRGGRSEGAKVNQQPNARTYQYLHDTLGSAVLRLEGAQRYAQGDPLLANALRHIRGSVLQARAALAVTPPVLRTQSDQKEAKS